MTLYSFLTRLLAVVILLSGSLACERATAPAETAATAPGSAAAPAGELNVYWSRHYDSDKALIAAFEAESGIKVKLRESGAPELLETMKAEGANSPADVIIAADAGTLYRFKEAGLTQGVTSERLNRAIPASFRETDGHWFGLAKRARVIVYDPQVIAADEVDTYADLASPGLKGEICVRSSTNIYNLSLLGELIGRNGADTASAWAKSVATNFAREPQGGDTAQIEAVAAGQCAVALVNHYYWVRLATGTEEERQVAGKTQVSFPDQNGAGTHVNVTAAAVSATSKSPETALRFIEFLASPQGQALLTAETKEYPIVAGVPLPAGLEALPAFRESDFPLAKLGSYQAEAQAIFDRAGWN